MTRLAKRFLILFAVVFATTFTLAVPEIVGSEVASVALAREPRAKTSPVRGYTKKNGTHVKSYKRAPRSR